MDNDVVDWVTGEIDTIGLATGDSESDEISGGGYTALSPSYGSASGGSADLSSTLEFDGPANEGPITHVIFRNSEGVWEIRPVDDSASFNSDGRLDLTSAPISATVGS